MIHPYRFDFTTNNSGAVAITASTISFNGRFVGIEVVLGTASAVDVTITDAQSVVLYAKTGLTSSMILVAKNAVDAAGSAITNSALHQPVVGPLSLTIANGGDTKTASVIVYVESQK